MKDTWVPHCQYCKFRDSSLCGPDFYCIFQAHYLGKFLDDDEELPYKSSNEEDCRVTDEEKVNRIDEWGWYWYEESRENETR